ncbi:hypothetical protein PXZ35_31345 [Paraburkholderia kururiensis]
MLAEIAVDSELVAVELDVDSDVTELFVVERPVESELAVVDVEVESELTPVESELAVVEVDVESELMPVESELAVVDVEVESELTPVDSELTVLFVLDNPVDSELMPVEVEVESESTAWLVAKSCEPLMASVLVALTRACGHIGDLPLRTRCAYADHAGRARTGIAVCRAAYRAGGRRVGCGRNRTVAQ